ncbi:nitrogen fixation protein FixH [Pseudoxanthomonas gei]|uniref:Nitrogen fixation protein FixH n=1 Tax=Pseudoxanthomonas gei TaxID=1383030 RepID=A0ABX0A7A8_9GAMM|nr:FixH family protein [Pseudoxanthomonas gei]NDK37412.1 nitrogen fixation protein FixH [Pseudoxanthomonas gei]
MNSPKPTQDPTPQGKPAHDRPRTSPWRQPVMWLVIGLPLASVVAGIIMVIVAGGSDAIDTSPDQVRRTAQIQTTDLGPDEAAGAARLSAIVRLDPERKLVEVLPVSGDFERNVPLRLALAHPTRAELDVALLLQPTELGWRAAADLDASHDWNIRLGPADGHWRLQGRLPRGQLATNLQPRLEAR